MTDKDLDDLKEIVRALTKQCADLGGRQVSLNEIVGESYVQELATMTKADAIHHLRSASGEKLLHAYLVLSSRPHYALRANHPVLGEVCLILMQSSKVSERILGAGDLGIWLVGTKDKNASHALAVMISNKEEADSVRSAAYDSLELINNRKTYLEIARRNQQTKNAPINVINEIDWHFVRSFL